MSTGRIVFEQTSQKPVNLDRILQITLEALKEGDFITALDQFDDEFTFIDHALELEFSAKDRLTEFFTKRRRLFPEFERTDNTKRAESWLGVNSQNVSRLVPECSSGKSVGFCGPE